MIYLDSAATTPIASEVIEVMMPYIVDVYGNAGAVYKFGRTANSAIQKARVQTAALFNSSPESVVFTSGATEGNNAVFNSVKELLIASNKKHLIVSATEHSSVMRVTEALINTKSGFYADLVYPNASGVIPPSKIEDLITDDTGLVSIMYVNNETGAVNDVKAIGELCRKYGILFHCDCTQAAGSYPIDVKECCMDFATMSAHKIYGPKGVGAMYIKKPAEFRPLIYGGATQEFGLRGGTENIVGIVGLGEAAELAVKNMRQDMIEASVMKQRFFVKLKEEMEKRGLGNDFRVIGRPVVSPGKILNLCFDGIDSESLVLACDARDVCISAGSACHNHNSTPSYVLRAMGLSEDDARSCVRISFSKYNRMEDVLQAAEIIADCVCVLSEQNSSLVTNNV